jgi:4-hydroxyphenylacetate 3-monooxygenase
MIRTGQEYRDSIRDGRRIWVNGERVNDVTTHPQFKPLVDIRARIFDMQHEEAHRDIMTEEQDGERNALGSALPRTQDDWWAKRRATDHMLNEIGGVVTRVGDETVGEMCSRRISRPTSIASCGRTPSTFRQTPTRRATARKRLRIRTPTCSCMW